MSDMDPEQSKEWSNFEQQALDLVRKGNVPDEVGVFHLFQIVILPSFDPAMSWEVYRKTSRSGEQKYFVINTRWRRDTDIKRFETPMERLKHPHKLLPTLETMKVELPINLVELFLDRLKSVTISAYIDARSMGTDGIRYEF